jgi:hypothetical protein
MAEVESNPERIRYAQETGMIIYDPDGFAKEVLYLNVEIYNLISR